MVRAAHHPLVAETPPRHERTPARRHAGAGQSSRGACTGDHPCPHARDRVAHLATGYPMSSPLYLAIDHPHLDTAVTLAQKVRHHVGGLKLGLEFFCANGHHGVHEMAKLGLPIFLDLKLHDIPNTVAKAIQALRPLEPAIITVHAAGGRAMLEEAKASAGTNTK
eukprot:gene15897-20316_t